MGQVARSLIEKEAWLSQTQESGSDSGESASKSVQPAPRLRSESIAQAGEPLSSHRAGGTPDKEPCQATEAKAGWETEQYLPNGASAKSGLHKSISDSGWGMFTEILQVKAECARWVVAFVDPKYTSQICSNCGTVKTKTLGERWHSCVYGCELYRDTNATKNILKNHAGAGSVPQVLPWGVC